jgi:hypothetical protein
MNTAHKDLKPGMQILTARGWATVRDAPTLDGGKLVVRLTDGRSEIRDSGHLWVRRTTHPLPTQENRSGRKG